MPRCPSAALALATRGRPAGPPRPAPLRPNPPRRSPASSCSACRACGANVLVAVVGATATGKSDLAVELALALDGEVVNADSLQLYRGMDIGTAKLPPAERRGVAHHLLDVLDVDQEAALAAYQRDARR